MLNVTRYLRSMSLQLAKKVGGNVSWAVKTKPRQTNIYIYA